MKITKVKSCAAFGLDAFPVEVEVVIGRCCRSIAASVGRETELIENSKLRHQYSSK